MKIERHKVYGLWRADYIRRYLFECFLKARVGSLLYHFLGHCELQEERFSHSQKQRGQKKLKSEWYSSSKRV